MLRMTLQQSLCFAGLPYIALQSSVVVRSVSSQQVHLHVNHKCTRVVICAVLFTIFW